MPILLINYKKLEQGFSLIEVILAYLILSIGLISFIQSQSILVRTSQQAYFINLANLKNNELAERLYACDNQTCIQTQLLFLQRDIAKIFPDGELKCEKQSGNYCCRISWRALSHSKFKQSLALFF